MDTTPATDPHIAAGPEAPFDIDGAIAELALTPAQQREYDDYVARVVEVPCPFRNCTVFVDPVDGVIAYSTGLVGCGCDYLPGWRAKRVASLAKPGWPVKAVGRHGGRIARSRRLRAEHARWLRELGLTLPS